MDTAEAISTAPAPPLTRREAPEWWPEAVALVAAGLALGVALLGPRLLPDTDPRGVDPYALRLGAVAVVLLAVSAARAQWRSALPVMVAVAAVVLPFVLWSAGQWLLTRVSGDALGFRTQLLVTNAAYALASVAIVVGAARLARASWWRWPRLGCSWRAAGAAALTVVLMVLAQPRSSC